VCFIATGESKAALLPEILQTPTASKLPSALIRPSRGELHWFVDPAAAAQLPDTTTQTDHSSSAPVVISAEQVLKMLPMGECIEAVAEALQSLASGKAAMPLRMGFRMPLQEEGKVGILASMPSYASYEDGKEYCANKVITVFPGNVSQGIHSHQGSILLFEANNGKLLAVVDASEVTAIRTAAASAVATRALANTACETLAIIGSGTQAEWHLEAMLAVRPSIKRLKCWSRTADRLANFVRKAEARHGGCIAVETCASVEVAVADADIICTVTAATAPILCGKWIKQGAHINAVGACQPPWRELDTDAVLMSRLYTDSRTSCMNEPGDFVTPLKEGSVTEAHIVGEIGELLLGKCPGRGSATEVTLFESLGLAVEDLAAALHVYKKHQQGGYL
jgi:ornithine cyclodeaminase